MLLSRHLYIANRLDEAFEIRNDSVTEELIKSPPVLSAINHFFSGKGADRIFVTYLSPNEALSRGCSVYSVVQAPSRRTSRGFTSTAPLEDDALDTTSPGKGRRNSVDRNTLKRPRGSMGSLTMSLSKSAPEDSKAAEALGLVI